MNHSEYIQALLKTVDVPAIKRRHYRILLDPANGSAIDVGKQLFSRLGELVMINGESGKKPPRPSEPRRETLKETAKLVVKNKCDLGIATDVDADRVVFIDETGTILSEDLTAVILAKYTISTYGRRQVLYVTPVNSSGIFKTEAKKWAGKVIECRVGPPEIIAAIKKHHADFAYEESGKYFFARHFLWADGLMAGVQMLNAMVQDGRQLSQIRKSYPEYYQVKLAVPCSWGKMPGKWIGLGEKRWFGDSFMFIRASGTESLIRIFADSPSQVKAQELAKAGKKEVEALCGV